MLKEYLFLYKENVGRFIVKLKTHFIVVSAHNYKSAMKKAKEQIPHGAWLYGKGFVEYQKRVR